MMQYVSNQISSELRAEKKVVSNVPPWQKLANAIVEQAVTDYRRARARVRANPQSADRAKAEVCELEIFFRSQWFEALTNVDGRIILSKLKKEAA